MRVMGVAESLGLMDSSFFTLNLVPLAGTFNLPNLYFPSCPDFPTFASGADGDACLGTHLSPGYLGINFTVWNNGDADAGHFIVVVQFLRRTCMDTPSGVSCTPAPSVDYIAGNLPRLRAGDRVTLNVPSDEAQRDCAWQPDCPFNMVFDPRGEVTEISEFDNEHLDGFIG